MTITTDSSCFGSGGGRGGVDDLFEDPGAWPPGFRFHPTDEELILYYLKRKMCRRRLKLNVIADVDVYKWHPEELPGQSILKSKDRQWFFFSPRDRKYPNGGRSNRATRHGYWKATGKDRNITWNSRSVGVKKTLVFYKGRAPSGERTDWVMHEYTMEEEELKRCKNAQDSYALYKVFKKSGPGPKNGEQYGAPFREEDWVDDDELGENNTPKKVEDTPKLDTQVVTQGSGFLDDLPVNQLLVDDFNKFFEEFDNVHGIDQVPNSGFPYVPPQIGLEEDTESNMMGPSLGEVISTDPISWYPSRQDDAQTNFDATQSAFSCRPPYEAPEVTSSSNVFANDSLSIEDVGFLELNDLVGTPQINEGQNSHVEQIAGLRGPLGSSDGMNAENSHIELMNELDGPELYFDPVMFLEDMGTIDQGEPSNPYFDSLRGDLSNQVGYQPPIQLHQGDSGSSELWLHEQRAHVFTSAESNLVVMAPEMSASVSMVHAGSSTSPLHEQRQNQDGNEDGCVDSWFSSAISGFLASVPTRPALASESALNRAFERMSSFSRVNAARVAGVATGVEPVVRRRVGRNGGFLFLSVLGVLCAVLWMLMIGTTVKILKTFFGRFIFS